MQEYATTVAVLGASGYSGAELLRLLAGHPRLEVSFLGAHDAAGRPVGEVFPHLAPFAHCRYEPLDALDPSSVEAALLALPPGMSATLVPALVEAGVRVVDLAGDFRLPAEAYPAWYGFAHPNPAWLDRAVYGLPELFRKEVAGASLVANPGCYPTPVLLGLAPLLSAGLVSPDGIVVDGKSGISGAGKRLTERSHFASLDGSVQAYRVGRHQHTPEMEHGLALATGTRPTVTFVPHLVPAVRGVVTTAYARLSEGATGADLRQALEEAYAGEPFVRLVGPEDVPDPKRVTGTNVCELGVGVDEHARTAVVIGAVDNLGKGAAGQAIQNLNLVLGLGETLGLPTVGVYP
jgi:N-acetyl-gamma-glutamyl-phosphate reductase